MTYFLDTSVIIDILRKKDKVMAFVSSHLNDMLITSSICEMETASGIYRGEKERIDQRRLEAENIFSSFYEVVSFDSQQAYIAGRIKAELSRRGELIDDLDILIASSAIIKQATLITANTRHFRRIKELQVKEL